MPLDSATVYKHLNAVPTRRSSQSSRSRLLFDTLAITDKPTPFSWAKQSAVPLRLSCAKRQWYKKQDKDLYRQVEKGFHGSTGTGQKDYRLPPPLQQSWEGVEQLGCHHTVQGRIGALRSVIETTGWITQDILKRSKSPEDHHAILSGVPGMRDAIMERALELSLLSLAHAVPPKRLDRTTNAVAISPKRSANPHPWSRRAGFGATV